MRTTLPDRALMIVIEALELAPPSPTVLTMTPGATLATVLRQCGTIAGIASERARGPLFKTEWASVEAVVLLACFALERHIDGDGDCATRMLTMASDRLKAAQAVAYQDAVA